MSLIEEILKKQTITNTKGGEYYATTYNRNLDMFSMLQRSTPKEEVLKCFKNAYVEDEKLAIANLLYLLDIRDGKGERDLFKICFKWLCDNGNLEYAKKVLYLIGELGRYDYVLVGLNTRLEQDVINLIKDQLREDYLAEYPSLLAKWLPTNAKNGLRKQLVKKLGATQADYRKVISKIRARLNLIETKLANKDYDIDFEKVPAKAMLRYKNAFKKHCKYSYEEYLEKAQNGEAKVNTKGLFAYEIVKKIYDRGITAEEEKLYDSMWEQQKDVLKDCDKNILVMADTSGSMTWGDPKPIWSSIGLALYIAERNKGAFKDYYMTFSSKPFLQKVEGLTIADKINNMQEINANTNIDAAFALLLETAKNSNIPEEEMPSHIIIVSDMEFDDGVYSATGTNLNGWKAQFKALGYTMPKIIFWNVSNRSKGTPATKFDNDVAMISGFSTSVFENILDVEKMTPINIMLQKLAKYLEMI